jgi:hypothetical protein
MALLRTAHPNARFEVVGMWVLIPLYPLPAGWNRTSTDVAFQVPPGYPATPPYGIYVPVGLLFGTSKPNNYQEPAGNQPPFGGQWGVLSWAPADGDWQVPSAEIVGRASLLSFVRGMSVRFQEGA